MCIALPLSSTRADAHTTLPARLAPAGPALAQGTVVGRFVVLGQLGRGGMGIVYTAYDPELDRNVALKLLHPGAIQPGGARAPLLVEAQAMARINHANVIAVYDVGMFGDHVFAAMELVVGTTLRRWMTQRPRAWRQVVDVLLLAGEGLAAAHAAGIVHRDFKPENVLLGDDGRVKVTDFGLASPSSAPRDHVAGTPGYLPAEALALGSVDQRGDQFSFCVTFHEALHGCRPFSARTPHELVAEVRRGPARVRRNRGVPGPLHDVLRRGLSLGPDDRYASMHELLAQVRRAVTTRRARRIAIGVVGIAATAAAIAAALLASDDGAADQQRPCAGSVQQLAGVWDAARHAAVRSVLVDAAPRTGPAVFDRISSALDRYASEWASIRTDACEATEVRHVQPASLLELRMACLDRARIQLRALVDALLAVNTTTLREASAAVDALPALDACSDAEALRAIVTPPLGALARSPLTAPASNEDEPSDSTAMAELPTGTPDFRLPFGCGETWRLAYGPSHRHADAQVKFSLPGEASASGLAVFASAPGWVSAILLHDGEIDINHGRGWFTTYQHMSDITVALHQYVGRGHVIGKVSNVNVKNALGGPGPAFLQYEQVYQPGVDDVSSDRDRTPGRLALYLERETLPLGVVGPELRTSTNNCAGGIPGSATQYDVPALPKLFSHSRQTIEVMVRKSDGYPLFEHWYNNGWNGSPMPYTIAGRPAVVVYKGDLHVIARKADGAMFDLTYSPFTGWKTRYMEGRVAGDPDAYVDGWNDRLYVAARGTDGILYRWWQSGGPWTHAVPVSDIKVIGTPALFSHYDTLYIVARAEDGSLWTSETDRKRGWVDRHLAGVVRDDPSIGADPASGLVNIIARGADDRIYLWGSAALGRTASRAADGWSGPELVDGDHVVTGAPVTTIYRGSIQIFARGPDNALYRWWKDTTWHWEATVGAYADNPDVFQFGDQLQTIGRGVDGKLHTVWYDPLDGHWNVENHEIPVAD
ncbi:MAG TPA: protein kinase [Kofleriaceae bacterium]|nr:protein kinase [Kofleriaceae bacterium]